MRFGSLGKSLSVRKPLRTKAWKEDSGAKSRAPPQSIGKGRKKATYEAKFLHSLILDLDLLSLFYLSSLSCGASVCAACCVFGAVPEGASSVFPDDRHKEKERAHFG